jgi:hypothetical protein
MTGIELVKEVKIIKEIDDGTKRMPVFPTAGSDEELANMKQRMNDSNYKSIERSFKKLWGFPDRIVPETENDGIPFLIEKNFSQNISEVTG